MDFQKSKIYLDKLNREFARMSKDPENTVRIDVDIMASYVRELYDAILSESTHYITPKPEHAPMRPHHKPHVAEPVVEMAPPPPPPPVVADIPIPAPPPAREEPPAPAPPPPPPVVEEIRPAPVRTVSHHATGGLEVLFEEKQAKELAEKLAETPISDLKKAIPLNDRLQFTSELFAGDGKAFESALASLNSFSHFEEAKDFLIQHCAVQYAWTDKKRVEAAKAFVKLVRRRYK